MKNKTREIPFEVINASDYIWRTPREILTVRDSSDSCPKCKSKLRKGFALIPIDHNKKAKVPGLECANCSHIFITNSKPVRRLLIDNNAAKDISLDGEYYWNYTQKKIKEKRRNKYQKLYGEKMEELHCVSSGLVLITVKSENSIIDYIICQSKNDLAQAINNAVANKAIIIHYSHPIALELLTKLYKKELAGRRTLNGAIKRI